LNHALSGSASDLPKRATVDTGVDIGGVEVIQNVEHVRPNLPADRLGELGEQARQDRLAKTVL